MSDENSDTFPEDFTFDGFKEDIFMTQDMELKIKEIPIIKPKKDIQQPPQQPPEPVKPVKWVPLNLSLKDFVKSEHFVIQNTLGDGNCLFRSFETALEFSNNKFTHVQIREVISNHVKKVDYNQFQLLLQSYVAEMNAGEFIGKWNPKEILELSKNDFNKAKESFIKIINTLVTIL